VNCVMRQGKLIEIVTIETVAAPRKVQRQEPFAKVPLTWAASAAKATRTPKALVWVLLLHTAWRTRSATFPLSNVGLAENGVSREIKRRALAEMEAAGLIVVERRPGRAPRVTLVTNRPQR
jgi:hypothetical protein